MKKKTNIENLNKENVFKTPEGYFENFSDKLMQRLQQNANVIKGENPTENSINVRFEDIKKENIFIAPKNYFEDLSLKINTRIELGFYSVEDEEQEIEEDLGILSSIEKKNIYSTPEGYFENSKVEIELRAGYENKKTSKTKIISFIPQWLRYSASVAAVFILIFVGYGFYKNNQPDQEPCKEMLCNVTDDEILQYLDENGIGDNLKDKNTKTVHESLKNNQTITEEDILGEIDSKSLDHLEN